MFPIAATRHRSWRCVGGKAAVLPSPGECTNQCRAGVGRQGKQPPGCRLRVSTGKMSEQIGVRKVPQSAGIIRHSIDGAGNVVMTGDITMVALVQSIVLQEVGTGRDGCGRTFRGPGHGGAVITCDPYRALARVDVVAKHSLVANDAGEFEVRNGNESLAVVSRD